VIPVQPAEPGRGVARELGLADEAVAIGIGGIERQTLLDVRCRTFVRRLRRSSSDRDGDMATASIGTVAIARQLGLS
jgi:hypothetical protein